MTLTGGVGVKDSQAAEMSLKNKINFEKQNIKLVKDNTCLIQMISIKW